jgi:Predicted membrane protein (DUF2306)
MSHSKTKALHTSTLREVSLETPLGLRIGFWVCLFIGFAVVIRRVFSLRQAASPGAPPELARLDGWFRAHAVLTYVHILTAFVFLGFLMLIFWQPTRRSVVIRSTYYGLGTMVGLTAYAMSAYSVGGWVERAAVLFFNTFFLVSLALSFHAWRNGTVLQERRWTLRSAATVLGIATTRPVMGIFFATSRLTHWTPQQFFGPAFWIGFAINVIVMELWLHKTATQREGRSQ